MKRKKEKRVFLVYKPLDKSEKKKITKTNGVLDEEVAGCEDVVRGRREPLAHVEAVRVVAPERRELAA